MVREVNQLLLNGGSNLKKFFHGQIPKDEPTSKNLVWNKSSSHSREKLEKAVGGGGGGGW